MNKTENLNNDCTHGEQEIKYRTECPVDAETIRTVLWPWILGYKAEAEPLAFDGKVSRADDAVVTLRLCPDAPSVQELRYVLDAVPNAHIAADTMEAATDYTGERESRVNWTGAVRRPSQEVLSAVLDALLDRQKVLVAETERMQMTYRTLRAMHDLGSRWKSPVSEGNSPGWLAVLEKPSTDLKRIVVVKASSQNDLRSTLKQDREVQKRVLVLNG